ncbi:MAG TPA: hypothetical protein VHT91_14970, partial [Kofleriaceae bacterium]|nr:hypothetical protein [Kofleriaceae bacterium]
MTRWIRPPELERPRVRDRFDPSVEGSRHGLTAELALAIWNRACDEATDERGRIDDAHARRRFHEIAARVAAGGGALWPAIGRRTRVDFEPGGGTTAAPRPDGLPLRVPGRTTLVAAEEQRWSDIDARHALVNPAPGRQTLVAAELLFGTTAGAKPTALPEATALPQATAAPDPVLPVRSRLHPRRADREAHEARLDAPGAVTVPRDLDLTRAASYLHAHTLCDAIHQALVDDRVLEEERLRALFADVAPDLLRTALALLRGRTVAGIDAFTLLDLTMRGSLGRMLGASGLTVGAADAAEEREADAAADAAAGTRVAPLDGVRIHADRR